MSDFLSIDDYKVHLKSEHRDQILEDETYTPEEILDEAESQAIAVIKDALKGTYDLDAIFDAVDDDRPKNVLRWATTIVVYFLYERIPDDFVPDRVVKNYNDTMDLLDKIAEGERKVDLPILVDEDGNIKTRHRWGSEEKRSH